jgi:hypothetical protein
MEFASPRFARDPVLEEILDDPDTGTKKLQPGSPVENVKKVQEALFELGWTKRLIPPFGDHDAFVIGIYGPITSKTVTAYKTQYHIHFPPSAPTGFIANTQARRPSASSMRTAYSSTKRTPRSEPRRQR